MASNLEALNAFRGATNWEADAIANINDGAVEQNGIYTGKLSAIRRSPLDCDRNNAMRTALLNALGDAFSCSGLLNDNKDRFSAAFMSKLERLIGSDFNRSDFGVNKQGYVKSGRPLTARRITAILSHIDRVDQAGRNMDRQGLDKLGEASSGAEIHKALEDFYNEVVRVGGKNGDLVHARLVQSAIAAMPEERQRALAAALMSRDGRNLLSFYSAMTTMSTAAKTFYFSTVMQIVEQLKSSLGLDGDELSLPGPAEYDVKTLPSAALVAASPSQIVSGNAMPEVKQRFTDFKARHGDGAAKVFRDRMNNSLENNIITTMAKRLGGPNFDVDAVDEQFEVDLKRDLTITVPTGAGRVQLPRDFRQARDTLVRFVANEPYATWDTASIVDKTKVRILMGTINQGMYAMLRQGLWEALDETRQSSESPFDLTNEKGEKQWTFELSREANGDIKVKMHSLRHYTAGLTWDAQRKMNITEISSRSFEEFDCEVTFPVDNMNQLARADWSRFNPKKVDDIFKKMGDTPKSRERQAKSVPREFRFAGKAEMSVHFHIETK